MHISTIMYARTLLKMPIGFLILFVVSIEAADLECYMGRNPKGHVPYLSDVCHRYKFTQPPACLKFTQGEIVTRDCDPSFICERFNIRNRCVRDIKQATLYGEICCCSTHLCNTASTITTQLSSTFVLFVIIYRFFVY